MRAAALMPEGLKPPLRNLRFYLSLRARALKTSLAERNGRGDDDGGLPVPPPLLRFRVHGALDLESYLRVGRSCAQDIKALLGAAGWELYSFERVLDFGCGSGRVLRFFSDRPDSCRLHGTDIDERAINWCRAHLPFASWGVNGPLPPTGYPDGTFDFIYAVSVFTHLDEEMQFAWLKELKRVSKPGGVLILTVHGERARSRIPEPSRALIAEKGFLYTVLQTGMFKADGLPDFYQHACHTRAYVEDRWSQFFEIIGYAEAGMASNQDAVILLNR